MTDLKRSTQKGGGQTDMADGGAGEHNRGAEFGTSERGTRGKDTDLDRSGVSKNQGHGHSDVDRNANTD